MLFSAINSNLRLSSIIVKLVIDCQLFLFIFQLSFKFEVFLKNYLISIIFILCKFTDELLNSVMSKKSIDIEKEKKKRGSRKSKSDLSKRKKTVDEKELKMTTEMEGEKTVVQKRKEECEQMGCVVPEIEEKAKESKRKKKASGTSVNKK